MRNTFVKGLIELLNSEKRNGKLNTYLLTGDLGFNAFEPIRDMYPKHIINAGIAEQNMVGVSGGMAMLRKNVFVYSIIPFILYRAFEQIRNDVCYPNLPVRFVGMGASMSYANAGATHHPLEDLKVADSLPNMTILSPSDPKEVEIFMQLMNSIKGPVYMRLSRNGDPLVHEKHDLIRIGKALKLVEGNEVLIVACGIVTKTALEVANKFNHKKNKTVEVLEIHTFKPFDYGSIAKSATGKKLVISIEDNTGALYEKVAVAIGGAEKQKVMSFKVPDEFTHMSGTREHLFDSYGITTAEICKRIQKVIE